MSCPGCPACARRAVLERLGDLALQCQAAGLHDLGRVLADLAVIGATGREAEAAALLSALGEAANVELLAANVAGPGALGWTQ